MTESTELSKAFAKQGLKIPIRNDGKRAIKVWYSPGQSISYSLILVRARKTD